jgi:hypothetical protein
MFCIWKRWAHSWTVSWTMVCAHSARSGSSSPWRAKKHDAPDPVDGAVDVGRGFQHDRFVHLALLRQHAQLLRPQPDRGQRVVHLVRQIGAHLAERGHLRGLDRRLTALGQLALCALSFGDVEAQRPFRSRVGATHLDQREQHDAQRHDRRVEVIDLRRVAGRRAAQMREHA